MSNAAVHFLGGHDLGQSFGRPDATQDRVAEEAVKRIKEPTEAIAFLRIIEFLFNYVNKAFFARQGLNRLMEEVAKDPSRISTKDLESLETAKLLVNQAVTGLRKVFTDSIDIPRDDLFVTVAEFLSFGLVKSTFPTTLDLLHHHLLTTMPEKFGLRIVVERWKAPSKTGSGQEFETVTFGPSNYSDTFVISEGARTSLKEDAEFAQENAEDAETAFRKAGVLSGAQAIPLMVRFLSLFVVRKTAQTMAKRAVLFVAGLATTKGALRISGVIAAYSVASVVLFGDTWDTLSAGVGDLATGVAKVMGGVKESADVLVIIGGVAVGVAVLGTALNFVMNQ